jgi:hypothetical protein
MISQAVDGVRVILTASEPIDTIPNNLPITPFRHPPDRGNFQKTPRRRRQQQPENNPAATENRNHDGHVDDYA